MWQPFFFKFIIMKRVDTQIIEIEDHFYPFRFSILSFMTYQTMYDKEITECKTITDYIRYFYCAYIAGCNFERSEIILTADEFTALIDSYPEVLNDLTVAFSESQPKKK